MTDIISWDDFLRVELRVGTVLEVHNFPQAKKTAYQLRIDLGEVLGVKSSSAQITSLYTKEELLGKQVVCVVNFPPKRIGPFISQVLTTGFVGENGAVVLAVPDKKVENGTRLA